MRKVSALMIAGATVAMLAGTVPANAARVVCRGPWHCSYWARGPHRHWQWRGGWHSGGNWVRHGRRWDYRWR
ncbi:MAG: hypothetical protein ACREE4_09590 [Stellaceae bacterium]